MGKETDFQFIFFSLYVIMNVLAFYCRFHAILVIPLLSSLTGELIKLENDLLLSSVFHFYNFIITRVHRIGFEIQTSKIHLMLSSPLFSQPIVLKIMARF